MHAIQLLFWLLMQAIAGIMAVVVVMLLGGVIYALGGAVNDLALSLVALAAGIGAIATLERKRRSME